MVSNALHAQEIKNLEKEYDLAAASAVRHAKAADKIAEAGKEAPESNGRHMLPLAVKGYGHKKPEMSNTCDRLILLAQQFSKTNSQMAVAKTTLARAKASENRPKQQLTAQHKT